MTDPMVPGPLPAIESPVYRFRETPGVITDSPVKEKRDEDAVPERGDFIICRFCSNVITTKKDIIEINGKHFHVCENPAGIIYRIGCFVSARGCVNLGEPTPEYTWFPGFLWRYAICSGCLNHLGWHYSSGGSGFYGLILDNLTENY